MLEKSASEILTALQSGTGVPTSLGDLRILIRDEQMESFVARSAEGRAAIGLLHPHIGPISGLISDYAELKFDQAVVIPGDPPVGPFMILELEVETDELESFASALFEGLLNLASTSWDECLAAAVAAVDAYQRKRQSSLGLQEQVGLFGELLMITRFENVNVAIDAWHQSKYSTFDFSIRTSRLEVKTSTSPLRTHWLSASQAFLMAPETVTFASLYAPPGASGCTIDDLSNEIVKRANHAGKATFLKKLDLLAVEGPYIEFDRATADASLELLPSLLVPRPQVTDPRIIQVKWKTGLIGLGPHSGDECEPWTTLLDL